MRRHIPKEYRFSFIVSSDLNSGTVGWVTQLVVDMEVRKRRWIATQLLQTFKNDKLFANVTAMGLVSSHPAACTAPAKYAGKFYILIIVSPSLINSLGVKIENIDLSFCRNNAKAIIEASPVDYVMECSFVGVFSRILFKLELLQNLALLRQSTPRFLSITTNPWLL